MLHALFGTNARQQWSTSAFRWLSVYAVGFAFVIVTLLGYVGYTVTANMLNFADVIMHWQRVYFDAIDDSQLVQTVDATLAKERLRVVYYGLFEADGRHVAGKILALPAALKPDGESHTLHSGLRIAGHANPPVVYASLGRRPDGRLLVIARDVSHLLSIRSSLIVLLISGGTLCLVAGLAYATVLSLRQLTRLDEIRRTTLLIAAGDLDQRLPETGGDELAMQSQLINQMLGQIESLISEVKGACDGIAHDLRTPLSHVRTLLRQSAERAQANGDAGIAGLIERAGEETDMLLHRFRALLRISEIGALQRRGRFDMVDIGALVVELAELYEPLGEERGITLSLQVQACRPISGDQALLFEAFSNLLDNAIKFGPDNTPIAITLVDTAQGPMMSISDRGPGMPSDQHNAVLQGASRLPASRTRSMPGFGLGIVSAVVRLHDHALRIDSTHPGTRVSVELWPHTLA
ncbi:HAMP domain-containing sensor histidine kinase [Massilia sp. METH4]|uniref:sensor histidine kinase n=1 Tax=Massilia sp. METH4 TaxID=3123041 RepID=UPI0030CD6BD1